ncbi:hypothetical protein KIL84_004020 [Mauremys mutica]|uniref:Nucleoporin Nup188 N-terminal subdomain III domain-containing protein n=1 Tax=Mauremys mutica TaxID=74926 RepID=A0A9D4BB69_9SAUR|nr:hypothetical protein KIL84_004020 [Mauremys mutica]
MRSYMHLMEEASGPDWYQDIIDAACEVLAASSIPQLFWRTEPTAGLGIILDSVCGMFPHLLSPLLQLLKALVSDKSTAKKVYSFLDKMSFYIELYKHKPPDVISHEDGTLWRRQVPKLLYPLGLGQTNLRIPQGTVGQVMLDDRAYLVRWEYSYSSWTLFTCEIEMLLHVVSTADVIQHCQRVKPVIDLVHKVISTDVSIADCLLPITSRIYMLLQRLTSVISPPVDVIASCVNCLTVLAARMPAKVWTDLHHTGFLPFVANPVSSMSHMISDESLGQGQLLIQTVKLAFSVTNNVIRLKSPSSVVSPLETGTYSAWGSLDQSLKDTLKKFSTEKRFAYWSGYVKSLALHMAETEGSSCTSLTEYQMLISAWRMLLIISTSHVPMSVLCLQLGSMLCTLLLILLKQWKSELGSVDKIINSLTQILEGVLQADQQMMEKTKAKVFSALITVLQMKEMKVSEIPQYSQLVMSVCETLQDEVIVLFDQTRHSLTSGDSADDKDSNGNR